MTDQRAFLLERYRAMDTEELVDLQRKGNLTEVAAAALAEVLAERNVTPAERGEIVRQLDEENPNEHLAPLSSRFGAQIVDAIVGLVAGVVIVLVFSLVTSAAGLAGGLVWIGYLLLADGLPGGQSLGKKFFKIAVVAERTGAPCGYGRSFLRNLTLIIGGIFDVLPIFAERRKRLGDYLAGTQVVKRA